MNRSLKQQILWILAPGAAYFALFFARPLWYSARCAELPGQCSPGLLNALDRWIPEAGSIRSDFYSNCIQNGAGILAFLLPWLLLRKPRPALGLNLILLALTSTNGALMEIIRALVQRPRPIVLGDPLREGMNIHHYTSFYSGHTSFVALALFFSWLWLARLLPERRRLAGVMGILYAALTAATAILRVHGGRHYPTDTLAGWIFGSFLAWKLGGRLLDQLELDPSELDPPSPSI